MSLYDGTLRFNTKVDTKGVMNAGTTIKRSLARIGGLIATAFSVTALVRFGKEALNVASDLQEVQNVVDVSFGKMSDSVNAWSKNLLKSYGISELTAKRMSSTYMAMGKGIGATEKNAAEMALRLTERAADIASFYNITADEAATKLKSVYTGETETLKSLGIVMTQTNLKNFAMTKGITQNIQEMDQATLTQLRYLYVMEQSKLAAGDFARTSESWANQIKLLNEKFTQLKQVFGQIFIEVLTPFIRNINTLIDRLLVFAQKLEIVISTIFGKQEMVASNEANAEAIDTMTEAQDDYTASLKKTNKEQKRSLASFDELNRLSSDKDTTDKTGEGTDLLGLGNGEIAGSQSSISDRLGMSDKEIAQYKDKLTKIATYGLILAGMALLLAGILLPNLKMIILGIGLIAAGYAVGMKSEEFKKPSWVSLITSWGFMILGTILLIIGAATANLALLLAGIALIAVGYTVGKSGGFENTPEWVYKIITWGGMILGVVLVVAGLITNNFVLVMAGLTLLMVSMSIGDSKGVFANEPGWVKQIITWGTMILGVVLIVAGLVGSLNPALLMAGIALLGFSIFHGSSSGAFSEAWAKIKEFGNNVKEKAGEVLNSIKEKIKEFFTNMKERFTRAKDFVKSIFSGIWTGIKTVINAILGGIEKFVNGFVHAINKILTAVNTFKIDVPDWVPLVGGKSIGFNLKTLSDVTLPRLASGTVIPANYGEFAAILGDNKREAEIVSPVSAMKQAFKEALSEMAGNGDETIILKLDGNVLANYVIKKHNSIVIQTGKSPLKGV